MDKIQPALPDDGEEDSAADLARRLKQYRRRIEAEGRPRSVKLVDRAIEDAAKKTKPD